MSLHLEHSGKDMQKQNGHLAYVVLLVREKKPNFSASNNNIRRISNFLFQVIYYSDGQMGIQNTGSLKDVSFKTCCLLLFGYLYLRAGYI